MKKPIWRRIPFFRYEHREERITYVEMTAEQKARLDAALKHMDDAFKEMDWIFGIR